MGKYNWTKNDLEYTLELLKNIRNKNKDLSKEYLLDKDIELLEASIVDFNKSSANKRALLALYNETKVNLESIDFAWLDIEDFSIITGKKYLNFPDIKTNSLSKNDLATLTHDFYKSLNRYFYGNFMKNYYRRFDHLAFNNRSFDVAGEAICLATFNETYISINRDYTINDLFSVVHEYSHATSNSINHMHTESFFCEMDTLFMELIAVDYFHKLLKDDNAIIVKADTHDRYSYLSNQLVDLKSLIELEKQDGEFKNNSQLKKAAFATALFDDLELEYLFSTSVDYQQEVYLINYILAVELYNQYKEDKELALNKLRKIIMLNPCDNQATYKKIKQLGVLPNKHLTRFQKDLENEVITLIKKQTCR